MTMRIAYDGATTRGERRSLLGARFGALLGGAMVLPRVWARRRRERHALSRLDDHVLRDIGLNRSRADRMARPFRQA